ncbi:MAG: hypothetical protein V1857_06840 [archaeon]
MNAPAVVRLSSLDEECYRRVICYPRFVQADFDQKISELARLGIQSLSFRGATNISGVPVLGKGCVGIVVTGYRNGELIAVKILRTDANRQDFTHEAAMTSLANSVSVGATLLCNAERILVTRYIDGLTIARWLNEMEPSDVDVIKNALTHILTDCYRLDQIGLDHGELSQASKHIIIEKSGRATILDFESASRYRRVANLTSVCQYLFLSAQLGERLRGFVQAESKNRIIETLKLYKRRPDLQTLKKVMLTFGLDAGDSTPTAT